MSAVWAKLDERTEECVTKIIDCAFRVHRALGPGFVESIYRNALCIELSDRGIPFECEQRIGISYRGHRVGLHCLDFVIDGVVIVELKAVGELQPFHHAQILSYLKATGLRAGLLMNFGGATLKQGLKRFVL